MKTRPVLVAALLMGGAVAVALRADWIVTRQGERFEVKGAPRLKGKLVVFTLPNGTLSSLRADRVDLEASRRATEQAKNAATASPGAAPDEAKPKRRALIVLTDKDFKKPLPAGAAETGAADAKPAKDKAGKDTAATEVPSAVEVVSWDRVPASQSKADGLEITGMVHNVSQSYLTHVMLIATLFDDNGGLIGRFPATVDSQVLPPAESSKFHLVASGVFAFASIRWETQGRGLKGTPPG